MNIIKCVNTTISNDFPIQIINFSQLTITGKFKVIPKIFFNS